MLDPVALQGAEIIAIAQIREQLFEDRPVPVAAGHPEFTIEVTFNIVLNAVVIEERIVYVNEKHNWARRH